MNDRDELISKENEAVLIEVLGPFWSAFFCSSGHDSRALLNPLLNRARSIPDGYVLVPLEPTEEQTCSGIATWHSMRPALLDDTIQSIYRAMIAASPTNQETVLGTGA